MAAKWYTRGIGVMFTLVAVSLALDLAANGVRAETWHKVIHVTVGLVVLRFGWNDPRWWRPFSLVNGALFTAVGALGWMIPDLGGLDAFNRLDTILHSLVGVTGLAAGLWASRATVTGAAA